MRLTLSGSRKTVKVNIIVCISQRIKQPGRRYFQEVISRAVSVFQKHTVPAIRVQPIRYLIREIIYCQRMVQKGLITAVLIPAVKVGVLLQLTGWKRTM